MDTNQSNHQCTKPRKRTKKLLNCVQQQLDFYFSDANLRHDRFLRKKIEENPNSYVELDTILNCNKMKALTTEKSVLVRAIENSSFLQVNAEQTMVRRITPLPNPCNTDSQTVYVEQLPAYADHEWLKQIFSTCGRVDYISLPRYHESKQIKGFAFIEFSNQESAGKACQILNSAAPYKSRNKKRQGSIDSKSAGVENDKLKITHKRRRSSSFGESDSEYKKSKTRASKRKRSVSISSDDTLVKSEHKFDVTKKEDNVSQDTLSPLGKRGKTESDSDVTDSCVKDDLKIYSSSEAKNEFSSQIEKYLEIIKPDECTTKFEKNKSKRKHRKKKNDDDVKEISVPPLYVISKIEWLNLKKQYKTLQKKEMSQLKKTMKILKSEKVRQVELQERIKSTIAAKTTAQYDDACKLKEKHGDIGHTTKSVEIPKRSAQGISGSVVIMQTSSEELTKKSIKEALLKVVDVSYVDYVDGSSKGFIRFPSAEIVDKLVTPDFSVRHKAWNFTLTKMPEADEKDYFIKVEEDRCKKYEQNNKKKMKKRGIQKITKAVQDLSSD